MATCPPDWHETENACYGLINGGSWTKSKEKCKSYNGSLVQIRSKKENKLVKNLLLSDGERKKVWIGHPKGRFKNWRKTRRSQRRQCPLMNRKGKWVRQRW